MSFNFDIDWPQLRDRIDLKELFVQYFEHSTFYEVFAVDGPVVYSSRIPKSSPAEADQAEFEASYKSIANRPIQSRIQEEFTPTNGHYQMLEFAQDIPAGSAGDVTIWTNNWPYGVAIYGAQLFVGSDNSGDELEVRLAPETIVGALTANAAVNDTVLNVSPTVLENVNPGHHVELWDGSTTNILGRCLSKDIDAGQLTVETAVQDAFSAATPTYVRFHQCMVKMKFQEPGVRTPGANKIGGNYLPAGTDFQWRYKNNSTSAKKFNYALEITY